MCANLFKLPISAVKENSRIHERATYHDLSWAGVVEVHNALSEWDGKMDMGVRAQRLGCAVDFCSFLGSTSEVDLLRRVVPLRLLQRSRKHLSCDRFA